MLHGNLSYHKYYSYQSRIWWSSFDCLLFSSHSRFTGDIAKEAHHVTAVDFMQSFTDKNEEVNGAKFNNIDFVCADVTKLELPQGR